MGGSGEAGELVRGLLIGSGIGTFCHLNTNELTITAGNESAARSLVVSGGAPLKARPVWDRRVALCSLSETVNIKVVKQLK